MERDFLGFNSKEAISSTAKDKIFQPTINQVFSGGPGMKWTFSSKVSALPHLMSFKAMQEERPKKNIFDPAAASAFQPISLANIYGACHKPAGISQKPFIFNRRGPNLVPRAYPLHPVDASHLSHELGAFPISGHSSSVSMSSPFLKVHNAAAVLNVMTNPVKQQLLGGIQMTNPHQKVPVLGSTAGTYASRNISTPEAASSQLTIFYAGTVNVYNDISPEKAQEIMFLAGRTLSINGATPGQVHASASIEVVGEGIYREQSHAVSFSSGLRSPMCAQSVVASNTTDAVAAIKTSGALASASHPKNPKTITPVGSVTGALMPAAVPQARKASLARFLEKRKERVANAAPYSCKNSLENASASDVAGLANKSETGSVAHNSSEG